MLSIQCLFVYVPNDKLFPLYEFEKAYQFMCVISEASKGTVIKTIVEEIDPRGKVLSSRVQTMEEKSTKVNNMKSEQRVPSWAPKAWP